MPCFQRRVPSLWLSLSSVFLNLPFATARVLMNGEHTRKHTEKLEQEVAVIRAVESENGALKWQLEERTRELERMRNKCANADEVEETIKVLRATRDALIKDKEHAAAAQGERVATIERLQRMQFQSKLELQHANEKLRSQVRPHRKNKVRQKRRSRDSSSAVCVHAKS